MIYIRKNEYKIQEDKKYEKQNCKTDAYVWNGIYVGGKQSCCGMG